MRIADRTGRIIRPFPWGRLADWLAHHHRPIPIYGRLMTWLWFKAFDRAMRS
jgi:hypothetical protein